MAKSRQPARTATPPAKTPKTTARAAGAARGRPRQVPAVRSANTVSGAHDAGSCPVCRQHKSAMGRFQGSRVPVCKGCAVTFRNACVKISAGKRCTPQAAARHKACWKLGLRFPRLVRSGAPARRSGAAAVSRVGRPAPAQPRGRPPQAASKVTAVPRRGRGRAAAAAVPSQAQRQATQRGAGPASVTSTSASSLSSSSVETVAPTIRVARSRATPLCDVCLDAPGIGDELRAAYGATNKVCGRCVSFFRNEALRQASEESDAYNPFRKASTRYVHMLRIGMNPRVAVAA